MRGVKERGEGGREWREGKEGGRDCELVLLLTLAKSGAGS